MFFSRKLLLNPTRPQTRCARLGPAGTLPSGPAWARRPRWIELDRGAEVKLTPWVGRGRLGGKCFQDCGWGLWEWDISGARGHLRPDVMDDGEPSPAPSATNFELPVHVLNYSGKGMYLYPEINGDGHFCEHVSMLACVCKRTWKDPHSWNICRDFQNMISRSQVYDGTILQSHKLWLPADLRRFRPARFRQTPKTLSSPVKPRH